VQSVPPYPVLIGWHQADLTRTGYTLRKKREEFSMKKSIKSYKQKGGIIADTVNIQSQQNMAQPERQKKNDKGKVVKRIFTGIFVFAAVVAILQFFGVKAGEVNMNKEQSEGQSVNVTSHNQQGGITAYNVNVESSPRKVTSGVAQQLAEYLPSDKNEAIIITAVMGDQEAFQFATKIKQHLVAEGRSVTGVDQAVYAEPIIGQIIKKRPDGSTEIVIGGKK